MTLLTAAPALAAAKPTTPASAVQTPNGVKFDPSKAKCSTVPGASAGTKRCVEMERLPLSDLTATQLAQRQQAMAKLSAKAKQAQAAAAPAAAAAAPAACGFSSSGVPNGIYTISPSRLLSCSDFYWTVLDVEVVDGAFTVLGDFPFEDQSWVTFTSTKLSWVHDMQTISYAGGGSLKGGVDGFMSSNCTAVPTACTVTSPGDPQVIFLASGSTNSWEWNEQDAGPASTTAGTVDNLDNVLGVNWDLVDGTSTFSQTETGGLYGRCDNRVAVTNTQGCVDENFTPTFYPSYALYGASADMVNFAENNIPPYYGNQFSPTPTPLHRLQSTTQQTTNRNVICDGSFTQDAAMTAALAPYTINPARPEADSCDEYPFAGTYESGAMQTGADGQPKPFVTTGANCWQGTAVQSGSTGIEPADWNVMLLDSMTTTTQCIRAHIPRQLNSALGGAYGNFVQQQRLLDKEAFWVFVTP